MSVLATDSFISAVFLGDDAFVLNDAFALVDPPSRAW
jgi:hypothetical protein